MGDAVSVKEQSDVTVPVRSRKTWVIAGIVIAVILIVLLVINTQFDIETIQVSGSVHYSDEEIIDMVVGDGYNQNTLVLFLKSKLRPMEDIPFVEKVDVEYISRHTITITVYEKAMAGCVQFMNEY